MFRLASAAKRLMVVASAHVDLTRPAIVHPATGAVFSHAALRSHAARLAQSLLAGRADLIEQRVAFMAPPSYDYAVMALGIWRAGGVCVPLCTSHPTAELAYTIADSGASVVVAHPDYMEKVKEAVHSSSAKPTILEACPSLWTLDAADAASLPLVDSARRALIIYTSGTTGPPKVWF